MTDAVGPTQIDARDTPLAALLTAWRPAGGVVPRWEQTLPGYLRHLALAVRPGTARTYLDALSRFIREVGDPLEASRNDVEAFLTRPRRGRHGTAPGKRSASTAVTERAALRRYFTWARRDGLRPDNPTDDVSSPHRQPYRDVRALTAADAHQLLAAIPTASTAGLRLRTLTMWFLITGRRHNEVLSLRWADIDLDARSYVYEGKGGKSERRELVPTLVTATETWRAAANADALSPTALVFPGRWSHVPVSPQLIRKQLQLVALTAGLGELPRPIHTLRHTNARLRREAGATVEDVQAALDHSSLATTAVYLRKLEGVGDAHGAAVAALLVAD